MEDIKEVLCTKDFLDIIRNSKKGDTICLELSNWDKKATLYNFLVKHDYISVPVYNDCGHYRLTLRFKDYAIADCVFEIFNSRYILNDVVFSSFITLLYLPKDIHIRKDVNTRDIIIYPEYECWRLYISNEYIGTYTSYNELKDNLKSEEIMKIEKLLNIAHVRISE